jgi:hypothetical protein
MFSREWKREKESDNKKRKERKKDTQGQFMMG